MPIEKYFGGHGSEVMSDMTKKHGAKKGKNIFYATANKRKQNPGDSNPKEGQHGSLEDITYMEEAATCDMVDDAFVHPLHKGSGKGFAYKGENTGLDSDGAITWGALEPPNVDGIPLNKDMWSANRDAGQGVHYGAPVDYFGPDTDYRAEEIDPHQYGKDWEPFPFKDVYKTGDKQWERGFRVSAQDEYDETHTPGAVTDSQPQTQAYGAVEWKGAGPDREIEDYRAFDSQRKFARTNKDKKEPYAVDISGLDTKEGKNIR